MPCPICKKETVPDYRPFCSKRCADIDLGRWLNGSYVIAGDADDSDSSPTPEGSDDRSDRSPGTRH